MTSLIKKDSQDTSEKVLHLFKNSILNCRYTFKSGKDAIFYNGEYFTDIAHEIAELEEEIYLGHPFIYRDESRITVSKSSLNPLEEIKRKAIEEYKAQVAAAQAANAEGSTSDQKFNMASIATSANVGEAASGSTSVDGAAASQSGEGTASTLGTGVTGTASLASLAALKGNK